MNYYFPVSPGGKGYNIVISLTILFLCAYQYCLLCFFDIIKTYQKKKDDQITEENQKILDSLMTKSTFFLNDWITIEEIRNYVDITRVSHPYRISFQSSDVGNNFIFFAHDILEKRKITIQGIRLGHTFMITTIITDLVAGLVNYP